MELIPCVAISGDRQFLFATGEGTGERSLDASGDSFRLGLSLEGTLVSGLEMLMSWWSWSADCMELRSARV